MSEWVSVEDGLPEPGTIVLICGNRNGFGVWVTGYGYYVADSPVMKGWISFGLREPYRNLGLANPTYWMPLPEPPEDE